MDTQEAVRIAEAEIKSLEYPATPQKRRKFDGESNKDYGAYLDTYEWDMATFNQRRKEYRDAEGRITGRFKQNLFESHGVQNNPKRDKVWNMAWDRGHSNGYNEVAAEFEQLVALIA